MNLETNAQKTIKNRGKLAQLIRLKEGFVPSVDGTKIYYKSMGWGLPIICNNGMGVSTFFWKYLENHFKHQFQVITWDYRGHGLSELPHKSKPLSVLSLVEDFKALVHALNVKKLARGGPMVPIQLTIPATRSG